MNKKGFTLVELLATLVILGIVIGIVVIGVVGSLKNAKNKTEDVFAGTLEDALDIYLDSDAKKLNFSNINVCILNKTHGSVKVYKSTNSLTFNDIINSTYSPLQLSDLVNPANEDVACNSSVVVNIYRDEDYVYYYKVNKDGFNCLKNSGFITNLPSECNG